MSPDQLVDALMVAAVVCGLFVVGCGVGWLFDDGRDRHDGEVKP